MPVNLFIAINYSLKSNDTEPSYFIAAMTMTNSDKVCGFHYIFLSYKPREISISLAGKDKQSSKVSLRRLYLTLVLLSLPPFDH